MAQTLLVIEDEVLLGQELLRHFRRKGWEARLAQVPFSAPLIGGETALARAAGNVTGAARLLKSTRETLRYRVEKYGLGRNLSQS